MKITITADDLLKNRETASPSGMLIDELAYSADQYTSDQIDEYGESTRYAIEYVANGYDYEDELLDNTKSAKRLAELSGTLECPLAVLNSVKHAGAWLALNDPPAFSVLLKMYTDKCKEETWNYYDSDFLDTYADDFAKELEKAEEAQRKQDYEEWLDGDYRNWGGVLAAIAKYYGASEAVDYDEKKEEAVFTFDDDEISLCLGYEGTGKREKVKPKEAKKWLINCINSSIDGHYEKEKAEREKRKAERERLAAYKAEQKAEADAKREAKLKKML